MKRKILLIVGAMALMPYTVLADQHWRDGCPTSCNIFGTDNVYQCKDCSCVSDRGQCEDADDEDDSDCGGVECGEGGGGGGSCVPCNNCTSTNWTATGTAGYESRTERTCDCKQGCVVVGTYYRCASGYCGTATSASSGCDKCVTDEPFDGIQRSVAGQNQDITSCYIPAGNTFSDSTGSGVYDSDCSYKK